jgi:hypothetical protein
MQTQKKMKKKHIQIIHKKEEEIEMVKNKRNMDIIKKLKNE